MRRCLRLASASTRTVRTTTSSSTGILGDENVWLLGGGSGHGFKHGPALGEMVAGWVLDHKDPDALFRLARFQKIIGAITTA